LATVANEDYDVLMPTKNVNLSDQQAKFIRQSIHKGRYRNVSEVVRAGLRLLEYQERQDEMKLKVLRHLADEAFDELDRGRFETVDPTSLEAYMAKVDAKARKARAKSA
jgi:antitoxin ParD1/3/4